MPLTATNTKLHVAAIQNTKKTAFTRAEFVHTIKSIFANSRSGFIEKLERSTKEIDVRNGYGRYFRYM